MKIGKDVGAGALFLFCGLFFAVSAWATLPIGTAFRMGPGFFPVTVGGLLALFGAIILAQGLGASATAPAAHPAAWRAVGLVMLSLVFFGVATRPLGMVPALLGAAFMAAFASRRMSLVRAAAIAAGLTAVCVVLFGYLLDLSLPLVGDWFR